MTNITAVKKYLERDARPITMMEFKTFWEFCTEAQKEEYSARAVELMGGKK